MGGNGGQGGNGDGTSDEAAGSTGIIFRTQVADPAGFFL